MKNLQEQISRIQEMMGVISEDLYSPAGAELTPNRLVVHVSNPVWRENIKLTGLQVSVGDCYSNHVGDFISDNKDLYTGCQPAIFATNSLNKKDRFDSTYDDDIWLIDTECAGVKWYWDIHFEWGDYPHIVTFENISPECIKLIHKGTGKSH